MPQEISPEETEFQKEAYDILATIKNKLPYALKDRPVVISYSAGPVMKFGELHLDIESDLPYYDQIVDRWWQVVLKLAELGAFKIKERGPTGCDVEVLQPRFDELYGQYEQTVQASESLSQPKSTSLPPWDLPPDTRWENVILRFLNGEEVQLEANGTTRHTTCEEMGFINKKTKRPNAQWEMLKKLARVGGEIHWGNNQSLSSNDQDVLKTRIKEIRKGLRAYFPMIKDDPFYDYRKEKAYRIKMQLIPESEGVDLKMSDDEEYLKEQTSVKYDPDENQRGELTEKY